MSNQLLQKNLIACTDLTDFKVRSIGLLPMNVLNNFATIIDKFTPIYREIIYEPNKIVFEKQLKDITAYIAEKNISDYFETGLTFYNSTWDASIPFEMAFYPLPNIKSYTASACYNNTIGAIPNDMQNYNNYMSVILHEIYHILYDEQPLAVKKAIVTYFEKNPSQNSMYAFRLLDEALATAMGNGYAREKLAAKIDTSDWYDSKYRNLMGKAIFPLVKEYIAQKKPIDQAFINGYIKIYDEKFPNWINEIDNLMVYRDIISENRADFNVIQQLFPELSNESSENAITKTTLDSMKDKPLTKLIIVSKNNKVKLEMIKNTFPELKKWKYQADKEFLYHTFLNNRVHLFIVNQHKSPTETLLKKLSTK